MENATKGKNLYGNWRMIAPDGEILAICTKKRAYWYIDRDLATFVNDDDGYGIQLLFEPRGRISDPYTTLKKENKCVVCGSNEIKSLTKHHIIPSMYRRLFPVEKKSRSSHDVVIICRTCHDRYEREFANTLKEEFAKKFNAPISQPRNHSDGFRSIMIAQVIINRWDVLPGDRLEELLSEFEELSGFNPDTFDEMNEYIEKTQQELELNVKTHPMVIMDAYKDRLQEFAEIWRKDFIDTMEPKYMPEGWDIKRKV